MAGSIKDLSAYRYARACEDLENAKDLLAEDKFRLALNRSYYAIFYAMRSVNALDEFDSRKHSGVIAHFNQYHVKTGEFPKELSRIIRYASEMRENADYRDFFIASKEEAAEQIKNAEVFLNYTASYLISKGILAPQAETVS